MAAVSKVSTISKVFSKLGDNTGSVVPMYVKDVTSDTLTSLTYFKNGGKMDGPEKTLEEFGTGVIWLGGIPFIKKFLFDKGIYKKKGINPDIDAKKLFAKGGADNYDTLEFASKKAKDIGKSFAEQSDILEHTSKNKDLAKKLSLTKFGVATAMTGALLFGLITYKKKRTEKELKKQIKEEYELEQYNKNAVQNTEVNQIFKGVHKNKENNNAPSFKGLSNIGTFFMTNPVANTAIVDGVITTTRMTQARKGEKFEVGFKEFCEIAFIYGLAKPLEKGIELISDKIFKKPIGLDYSALDSDVLKTAVQTEKESKGASKLLKQAKELVSLAGDGKKVTNENAKKMMNFIFDDNNKEIGEIFKRTGDVATFTTKEGVEQLSLLSSISPEKLKSTAKKTATIIEQGASENNPLKFLKNVKAAKGIAIVSNILISALLIGYVQPKASLLLRKKRNNGDGTTPAIKSMEEELRKQLTEQTDKKAAL